CGPRPSRRACPAWPRPASSTATPEPRQGLALEQAVMRVTLSTGTPAELALPPDGTEPALGLVLHPDIGGLRPLFDDHCARLAAPHGWLVCAPEPFPGRESMTLEQRMAAMPGLDDDEHLGDLAAAADLLAELGTTRQSVLGFCMGGMYAFKA